MTEQSPQQPRSNPLLRNWISLRMMQQRQRQYIRNEIIHARGLIPLLMKHRNGSSWTREERILLLRELRAVSNLSPYLLPLVMPGGVLMLPVLAWWMDYRGQHRADSAKVS